VTPEQLFLRYAYRCDQASHHRRLTDEDVESVKKAIVGDKALGDDFLNEKYPNAYKRVRDIEQRGAVDRKRAVELYFLVEHNLIIEYRLEDYKEIAKISPTLCEFCKVNLAEVTEVVPGDPISYRIESAKYGRKFQQQGVTGELIDDAKVGDLIVIHQGWAVKKIDMNHYEGIKNQYWRLPKPDDLEKRLNPRGDV